MVGVRLPLELEHRLNDLVSKTHHSQSYHIKCALEKYLNDQEDYLLTCLVADRIESGQEKMYTLDEIKNSL